MSPVFLFISGFARPSVKVTPKSITLVPIVTLFVGVGNPKVLAIDTVNGDTSVEIIDPPLDSKL